MATTCKKCFAPLASTERVCHSCGTPVEITKSSTWSGAPVQAAAPAKVENTAPETISVPGITTSADPFAAQPRTASEIGAAVATAAPADISAPAEEAPTEVFTPTPVEDFTPETSSDNPLPMPPAAQPETGINLPSELSETTKTADKKVKPPKSEKSEKFPFYMMIFTAIVAIGLAVALIYVLSNNSKAPISSQTSTSEVAEPYPARIGNYTVKLPSGYLYTHNGTEAIFYDDSQTWSVYAQVVDSSLEDIELLNLQIVENFRTAGYEASEMIRGVYNSQDYLTLEVKNGDSTIIVAYTAIDENHSLAMSVLSASRVADYTILENVAEIFTPDAFFLTASSPVNIEDTGINRTFVRDFAPYVPQAPEEPVKEEPPVCPAVELPEALQTRELETNSEENDQ